MTVLLERFVVALERIASALEGTRTTEKPAQPAAELDMEVVKAEMAAAIGKPGDSRTVAASEAAHIRGDGA